MENLKLNFLMRLSADLSNTRPHFVSHLGRLDH